MVIVDPLLAVIEVLGIGLATLLSAYLWVQMFGKKPKMTLLETADGIPAFGD